MFQGLKNDNTGYYGRQMSLANDARQASLNTLIGKIEHRKKLERKLEKLNEKNAKRDRWQSGLSLLGSIAGAIGGNILLPGFGAVAASAIGGGVGGALGQATGTAVAGPAKGLNRGAFLFGEDMAIDDVNRRQRAIKRNEKFGGNEFWMKGIEGGVTGALGAGGFSRAGHAFGSATNWNNLVNQLGGKKEALKWISKGFGQNMAKSQGANTLLDQVLNKMDSQYSELLDRQIKKPEINPDFNIAAPSLAPVLGRQTSYGDWVRSKFGEQALNNLDYTPSADSGAPKFNFDLLQVG